MSASLQHSKTRAVAVVAVLAALLLGLASSPTLAQGRGGLEQRVVHEEHYDSGPDAPDPYWVEQCDIRVRQTADATVTEKIFGDGTLMLRIDEQYRWYDLDTGRTLLSQKDSEVLIQRPVSETVDDEAGTRTLVLEVDYAGVPLRLFRPDGGLALMSAGLLRRTITVVFDLRTGELLTEDVEVTRVAGPHPFLEPSGFLDAEGLDRFVCEQLAG